MGIADLQDLVRRKVEHLRPKLLDLSRRNPLLATKLTPRSNAHIRVVDELPDVLFYKLNNGQEMRLVPLPEIDGDPKDEDTKKFRDAISAARLTEEAYLQDLESVAADADDYLDRTRAVERALKDRLRAELGMAPRPKQAEINLTQHARNNGITPSYELPSPGVGAQEERHTDNDIQTLLLPKDLERKLNTITSKCRTWVQETGINVLHVAYGFLEWSEPSQTDPAFAPLLLCSAQIEKKRTREGVEFHIKGIGEEPETNAVLAEKMRIDFGIEMPPYEGGSVEEYMASIAEVAPKQIVWKVRRQVAIGVFPSARMAMYHDIDPNHQAFRDSEIVRSLLTGTNTETAVPFAEEYNVDEPSIEQSVPCVVMDADSSQFSTLVDVSNGKNLAVEGPPGTGKSQTIVNAIAAALADGKKVLFVAEKLAALNVVRSRLESVGLGEFLLPLQAERSTREQVISSIRSRVEMRRPSIVTDYDEQLAEYRGVRQELSDYIVLLTLKFGRTGLSVHDILSKSIATAPRLETVPVDVIAQSDVSEKFLHKTGIGRLQALGERAENAAQSAAQAKPHWKATNLTVAERFTVEEACNCATRAAQLFLALAEARDGLRPFHITRSASDHELSAISIALRELETLPDTDHQLHLDLLRPGAAEELAAFISGCEAFASAEAALNELFSADLDEEAASGAERMADICRNASLDTLDLDELQARIARLREALEGSRGLSAKMEPLIQVRPEAAHWNLGAIGRAFPAIGEAGRQALLCRNTATNDPAALPVLKQLIGEGRSLLEERTQISARVSLSVDASVEILAQTIATLRSGGLFAAFSSSFRNARKLARSLSLADRFEKKDALERLEALASYRGRERAFLQNPVATSLFGLRFRGVDTDFAPFEDLARYYEFLETSLVGPDQRGLRKFLREADFDELELVPAIPVNTPVDTIASLQKDVASAEKEIAALTGVIDELRPLRLVLKRPKAVRPSDLPALAKHLRAFLVRRLSLDEDRSIATLLGGRFKGCRTPVHQLSQACSWAKNSASVAEAVAAVLRAGRIVDAADQIDRVLETKAQTETLLKRIATLARIEETAFTGGRDELGAAAALEAAGQDTEGLFAHAEFANVLVDLKEAGLHPLLTHHVASGTLSNLAGQFEALAVRKLARAVFAEHGQKLARHSGRRLDELRAELARQDKAIIKLAQKQLRWSVHSNAKPPYGNGTGKKSTWTQMALIQNEISKQQRFISVRDLTQRAGAALLELKPCWMMSPLAVAQYSPKEAITFDLCIIDEASQMPPEAAIGALLRSKQVMVVGDTNQLPPSSFFKKMIDDDDADEDDAVLNESILEMANATFRPARRLRWHYRSRHSGLIRFSNRLVYKDNLVVFPSATESLARMGVQFRKVDGLYKAGANATEARVMVDAALEFMRTDPNRSLGIVTLNQKQRDLIAEEFEYALGRDHHAQAYVEAWKEKNDGLEEFFIKNLENVQGDERDVIFIGTVYGPETKGARVAQRFGPINGLAGKRRLNVLFSRAKEKIVTYSSMTAADIVAEESGNAGAYMLKCWLEYAAGGLIDAGKPTPREPDSDFEIFVMDQIRAIGCEAVSQVGVAGYFIDIGVRHPEWPHGFILGVECDGASYHSAKSARDRDRLRQEVMERLGWQFHRIWSTDWFNNPRREAERLREVIEQRLVALKEREAEFATTPPPTDERDSDASAPEDHAQSNLALVAVAEQPPGTLEASVSGNGSGVAVGDTVRVRYLNGDGKTLMVTISKSKSDLGQGVIHHEAPIAKALLGAEEGDEVEVLTGPYVRAAVVEAIVKAAGHA